MKGWPDVGDAPHPDPVLRQLWAFERLQRAVSAAEVAQVHPAEALRRYRERMGIPAKLLAKLARSADERP